VYPGSKARQKILWAEVLKEMWKGEDLRNIWDLLADERSGRVVRDILSTTDVARRVPAEGDAASEVSEAALREFLGSRERVQRSWCWGLLRCSSPRTTSCHL